MWQLLELSKKAMNADYDYSYNSIGMQSTLTVAINVAFYRDIRALVSTTLQNCLAQQTPYIISFGNKHFQQRERS